MSLLLKLLAASDSRPKLREKQEKMRPGENSFLLIPCRSCSSSWLRATAAEARRKTGEQEARRQFVSPDPMSLLFKPLGCERQPPKLREKQEHRSTGGQETIRFS